MSIDTDYGVLRSVLTGRPRSGVTVTGNSPNPADLGWAVEFGVYTGFSTKIIAEHMPVIGFDSFEGLPEDWRPGFRKGAFGDRKIAKHLFPGLHPNIMLIKGWFDDTVPGFPFPQLGLVHIDCDLYSSTVTALEGVTPYVRPGTILVFDEFHGYPGADQHEAKAAFEWQERHDIEVTKIAEGPEEAAYVIDGGSLW